MRQSSFDASTGKDARGLQLSIDRIGSMDRIGAVFAAMVAFICYYQPGSPTAGNSVDASWMQAIAHGYAAGWQWGRDIVYTYGPLGFLTPYMNWNPDIAASFRAGQILLCGLWAVMVFGFARGLGVVRQLLLVLALVAWYPLLTMDIGWIVPFVFAIVLIHRWSSAAEQGRPRKAILLATVALLSLLALVKFTGQVLWFGIVGYGVLMGLARRDFRLAGIFGIGAPLALALLWLTIGQNLTGFVDYVTTSLQMSSGYGAMSLMPAPRVDGLGFACLLLLGTAIATIWNRGDRLPSLLVCTAFAAIAFIVWKAGYVRPDAHIGIFFGSAGFLALAVVCVPTPAGRRRHVVGAIAAAGVFGLGLSVSYGFLHFDWSAPRPMAALQILFNPEERARVNRAHWDAQAASLDLPRTRARIGNERVDVLMNEQATAVLNGFNFTPRPAFQGYGAYTSELTRINESFLLDGGRAPDFLLTKLQSIDDRLPAGEDPLSILAALRAYLPVDREGGYLVMQRTGWPVEPIVAPPAESWHAATLGADISMDVGPSPQVLFVDVRLTWWGRLRSFLLRDPNLRIEMRLNDGSERSYQLLRKVGSAGFLVSPFLLTENDYLRWHASLEERKVISLRLLASSPDEIRLFAPTFSYALQAVDLPRRSADQLPEPLQQSLYPGFSPAPSSVESIRKEIVNEDGRDVLFTHAPASIEFKLAPGEWRAAGDFGLLRSAHACSQSDGIALIAERIAADGTRTALFESSLDPVHRPEQRGFKPFSFGPFAVTQGDRVILRNAPGVAANATADCDWMFLGPVRFEGMNNSGG